MSKQTYASVVSNSNEEIIEIVASEGIVVEKSKSPVPGYEDFEMGVNEMEDVFAKINQVKIEINEDGSDEDESAKKETITLLEKMKNYKVLILESKSDLLATVHTWVEYIRKFIMSLGKNIIMYSASVMYKVLGYISTLLPEPCSNWMEIALDFSVSLLTHSRTSYMSDVIHRSYAEAVGLNAGLPLLSWKYEPSSTTAIKVVADSRVSAYKFEKLLIDKDYKIARCSFIWEGFELSCHHCYQHWEFTDSVLDWSYQRAKSNEVSLKDQMKEIFNEGQFASGVYLIARHSMISDKNGIFDDSIDIIPVNLRAIDEEKVWISVPEVVKGLSGSPLLYYNSDYKTVNLISVYGNLHTFGSGVNNFGPNLMTKFKPEIEAVFCLGIDKIIKAYNSGATRMLLTGGTGSGKSTKAIWSLYNNLFGKNGIAIIVANPRNKVCKELYSYMTKTYGDYFGVHVGGLKVNTHNPIVFCTPFYFQYTKADN